MATPNGSRADAARAYFARERRRKLQDLSDFNTTAIFSFGVTPQGTPSPNGLILPAAVNIALTSSGIPVAPGLIGVLDESESKTYLNADPINTGTGEYTVIRRLFPEGHTIKIFADFGTPAVVSVFFFGPKGAKTQIGQAFFT